MPRHTLIDSKRISNEIRIFAYGIYFGMVIPEQSPIIRNEFEITIKE